MDLILGILIALGAVLLSKLLGKSKRNGQESATSDIEESVVDDIDYAKSYQAKYLLTKNEWHEYKKLKGLAADLGLQVCPKIKYCAVLGIRSLEPGALMRILYSIYRFIYRAES